MAQPSLSREVALETVERVEEKLREGFRPIGMGGAGQGAVAVAADAWGISRGTMNGRIAAAKLHYGLEPDDTLYRPRQYQHHSPGAPAMVSQDHIKEPIPEGDPIVVCVIGDAHDSPHLPNKERFYWLGRFAAERPGIHQYRRRQPSPASRCQTRPQDSRIRSNWCRAARAGDQKRLIGY